MFAGSISAAFWKLSKASWNAFWETASRPRSMNSLRSGAVLVSAFLPSRPLPKENKKRFIERYH